MSVGPTGNYRAPLPEYAHPPLVAATLAVMLDEPLPLAPTSLTAYQLALGPEWIGEWSEASLYKTDPMADPALGFDGHQLTNVLSDRLIFVSGHHFAFTWMGTDDARYPRYENLRDGFVAAWVSWSRQQPLFAQKLQTWTVSYLNRIPQGTVWQTPADFSFCQLWPASPGRFTEDVLSAQWQLKLKELPRCLTVTWARESPSDDTATPAVWLRLAASGDATGDSSKFLDGMDAGRAAIVQTFSDVMSPAANAYWGLRRREK